MKKYLSWILAITLCLGLLAGCGGAKSADRGLSGGVTEEYSTTADAANGLSAPASVGTTPAAAGQKLIRKMRLEAETEDLDSVLSALAEKIAAVNGYVEQQEIYNGSQYDQRRYRNAEMTIRIPADKLDEFVAQIKENTNVISSKESADDITLSYVATQSRVSALETEHTRLLELLAKAETTKDLLEIEKRLTEVRAELEEYTSQLRLYDNLVDYATVNMTLREVKEYTEVEEPETVWERIGSGFMKSLKNLGTGITEIFIFFIVAIPYLMIPVVGIVIIVLIVKLATKKKK